MSTPPNLDTIWGGLSHPGPGPQELIADTVKYALIQLYERYGGGNGARFNERCSRIYSSKLQTHGTVCKTLSTISARDNFNGTADGGIWGLREDVSGKAGWIVEGMRVPGVVRSFDVNISASNPVVVIYYLVSYVLMGKAMVVLTVPLLDGTTCSANVTLDGLSSTRASVSTAFSWALVGGDADWPAVCAPENLKTISGYVSARVSLVDNGIGKFKLLGLRTC